MENNNDLLSEIRQDIKDAKKKKKEKPIFVKTDKKKSYIGYKFAGIVIVLVLLGFGVVTLAKMATDWGAGHQIIRQRVFDFAMRLPYRIEDRQPVQVISPLASEVLNPKEVLTPIEDKIVKKWGTKYGYIALATFRCESGLRADAVNWETRDIGITQINLPIWEKAIKEKFGYTLVDLFNEDKNLEVAYWIWDRADGVDGDGQGNMNAWVAFTSGAFTKCIK